MYLMDIKKTTLVSICILTGVGQELMMAIMLKDVLI